MLKSLVTAVSLLLSGMVFSQPYLPSWESIDKRPVPSWFEDSKFGIFIHWGVYSVPSWGPSGEDVGVYDKYSEWYWSKLMNPKSKVNKHFKDFHVSTYGENFRYQDFAPMFKAELFKPEQWADLFKQSGAKYVVLTSKHHEGFALWPSAESWNWNSVDIGPHRDLCGELTESVKSAGLKMGFYYSLYEWFNPVYQNDPKRYVDEHMIPQMKDLVKRYSPDIFWTDGEWDMTSKEWKSEEFIAWLYNESPVKNDVVINDRWGSETRSKHGGIYTTEYGLVGEMDGLEEPASHPWEECRGIGTSFGFNRTEGLSDYSTAEELIKILVSTVAAGGNLLLDIGPAADGTIPVIMQQRLMEIGTWLNRNGEAIYGTRPFNRKKNNENINPAIGKTLFLTRKGNDLFVTSTEWPTGSLVLKDIRTSGKVAASMPGYDKNIRIKSTGTSVTLTLPDLSPDDFQYAYVFRISGVAE
jgi:alpha-L-fucosidase